MKALTRMRKLAAVLALLTLTLALLAPLAEANVPKRPIDRPEGPPEPNPTEVGDPDDSQTSGIIIWTPMGPQFVLVKTSVLKFVLRLFSVPDSPAERGSRARRGAHAR